MDQYIETKNKSRLFNIITVLLTVLIIFIGALAINALKESKYIGHAAYTTPNVISVTGTGEVLAIPDTATFSFSVETQAKTVTDAQTQAATQTNKIITALKTLGVSDPDIKTIDYTSYPVYDNKQSYCQPPTPTPMPPVYNQSGVSVGQVSGGSSVVAYYPQCVNNKQILIGYKVAETVSVKVRKTADSGEVLTKVGELGATNISGLNFVIDNLEGVQAQARDKAIADAKSKAAVLSKSLGVSLKTIVNFSENGNQPPIYYPMAQAMDSKAAGSAVIPNISVGQNKITSNVTITYQVD